MQSAKPSIASISTQSATLDLNMILLSIDFIQVHRELVMLTECSILSSRSKLFCCPTTRMRDAATLVTGFVFTVVITLLRKEATEIR
jgi:hypothetical protein